MASETAAQELQRLRDEVEQLRQQQQRWQRLHTLVELMPTGFLVIDNRGVVNEFNPAAQSLLGTELAQRPWLEIINACFAPRPDDGHEVSLKNGRRVSLATQALPQEPGQLVFISDQTQTRELQEKLHHYQRLSEMGRMMASLAHQIRTPLSAALLYASHLMTPELTEAQRLKFAAKVKSRLTHLEQQVRDMLIFARGETRLDDRLSVDDLLQRLEEMLDQPLAQYDADCEFINQASGQYLQCNGEALLGALINLVNNALQASGEGAQLQVVASIKAGQLHLSVTDAGPGMDAQTLAQAQQPFYTTKSHGTGLGLAIAQVIAQAHHGRFVIESSPGRGTRAALQLPLAQTAELKDDGRQNTDC